MSDEKSRQDKMSLPPEAKRRGGMDTLFSAAWFDDAPEKPKEEAAASPAAKGATAAAPAPEKGSSTFLIVALVGGGLLFGAVLCSGIGLGVGAYVYAIGN